MSAMQNIRGAGGDSGGCFRAGTQVQLEHGKTIAIEKLKVGDAILSFNERGDIMVSRVAVVHFHETPQALMRVDFWRGHTYITGNHWVQNQYGTFAEMGTLTTEDALIDGMGHLRPITGFEDIGSEPVYNLTVVPNHTFIADGIRVHNGGHRHSFPVAGAGGGGGGGKGAGGGGRASIEDPDTLQSKAMISVLDLLGEGEIGGLVNGGRSIFFNDTPLQNEDGTANFNGVSWESRTGTQDQTVINGFGDIGTSIAVNLEAKVLTPRTVTITNPNADQVRVVVSVPQFLSQDTTSGDVHGTSIEFKIEVSKDGGAYVPAFLGEYSQSPATNDATTVFTNVSDNYPGATVSSAGTSQGSVTIQPETWNGSVWVSEGSQFTLAFQPATVSYDGEGYTIETPARPESKWIQASIDTTKMRFQTVSSTGGVTAEISNPASFKQEVNGKITGKTRSKYQRSYLLTLPKPASTWNIRLTRITADSVSSAVVNNLFFDSYTEIVNSRLTYPNSALVGVTIDASLFNQIPSRAYFVNGLYIRVPSNYNPTTREYSGSWDGTFSIAVSNNPAWILYDLLINERYGLGRFITADQIDKTALYTIGRYCDEFVSNGFGGVEPRFTINTAVQTQAEAYKLVSDISSVFRGMTYWNGSQVSSMQDSPTTEQMIFSPANVIDGTFTYAGSARKDRHSVVLISWNDPEENYKQKIEYVENPDLIARFGVRKMDTVAFGCTSRGQAHRVGRWILYTEEFESDMVTFKVGMDASFLAPGQVIRIHDPYRAGKRFAGRIVSATTTSATLDGPVTLTESGAKFSVRLPDGTFADRTVLQGIGVTSVLSWTTPLAVAPSSGAMWIVAETLLVPMLARVIGVTSEDGSSRSFSVSAIEHNPTKYGLIESELILEQRPVAITSAVVSTAPTNFVVSESVYLAAPGVLGIKVEASWFGSATGYELRWRRTGANASNWITVKTTDLFFDLRQMQVGTHEFEVRGTNFLGRTSPAATLTYEVHGKITPPQDVTGLTVTVRATDLLLSWDANPDIDLAKYEIRVGNSWEDSTLVDTNVTNTTKIHDQSLPGTYSYFIRAFDPSGNQSVNVATAVLTLVAPAAVTGFACVQSGGRIEFVWDANSEINIAGYEVREGASWDTGLLVGQSLSTVLSITAGATSDRTFWILAIAAPGIYGSTPVFTTTTVALPTTSNIIVDSPERANGFPGTKIFANATLSELFMDAGASRSEYIFGIDPLDQYRSQNTLFLGLKSNIVDSLNWTSATFGWDSMDAERQWVNSGILANVMAKVQISLNLAALEPGEVYSWGFNESLLDVAGVAPSLSTNANVYEDGRYLKGIDIHDGTFLDYTLSIPAIFNQTFWLNADDISDYAYCRWTGAGISLVLGYDNTAKQFYLRDHSARQINVPLILATGDRVLIGIEQTATTRTLMVGVLGGSAPAQASAAYASEASPYTTMKFY